MFDLLIVIIVLAVFGVIVVLGLKVFDDLNDEVQADDDLSAEAKAGSSQARTLYPQFFDNAFMLALILFWVLLLVSSFLIDTQPVFFIVTIILLAFTFIIGMVISNTYQDVTGDAEFSTLAAEFPKINWVMGNFLIIIIAMGFTSALALYAKART